ncbi:unnamed protein product [Effrenium voratum]|uniref:Uncharacterized protein n=1 Tax=Effrenium voratum TaxID=2562239 RepID=A0AA36J7R0_9DINO|nr:unnamed protein product [Effrenium voratum]
MAKWSILLLVGYALAACSDDDCEVEAMEVTLLQTKMELFETPTDVPPGTAAVAATAAPVAEPLAPVAAAPAAAPATAAPVAKKLVPEDAAAAAYTSPPCTGDGRLDQNAACKYNPSWSGCVHSPGCNWHGQSYFGGWCEGGPTCVYLPSRAVCMGISAGCAWQEATAPLNLTEGEVEAAMASQVAAAAWSAAASAAQAALEHSNCFGDGTPAQNQACRYHVYWGTCVLTAGCNWHGESALGGWCTGGVQCTYQPLAATCVATPGCFWATATAPLMIPMKVPAKYHHFRGELKCRNVCGRKHGERRSRVRCAMVGRFESAELKRDALAHEELCARGLLGHMACLLGVAIAVLGVVGIASPLVALDALPVFHFGSPALPAPSGSSGAGSAPAEPYAYASTEVGHVGSYVDYGWAPEVPPRETSRLHVDFSLITMMVTLLAVCALPPLLRAPASPAWDASYAAPGAAGGGFPLRDLLSGPGRRLIDVKPGELAQGAGSGYGYGGYGGYGGSGFGAFGTAAPANPWSGAQGALGSGMPWGPWGLRPWIGRRRVRGRGTRRCRRPTAAVWAWGLPKRWAAATATWEVRRTRRTRACSPTPGAASGRGPQRQRSKRPTPCSACSCSSGSPPLLQPSTKRSLAQCCGSWKRAISSGCKPWAREAGA